MVVSKSSEDSMSARLISESPAQHLRVYIIVYTNTTARRGPRGSWSKAYLRGCLRVRKLQDQIVSSFLLVLFLAGFFISPFLTLFRKSNFGSFDMKLPLLPCLNTGMEREWKVLGFIIGLPFDIRYSSYECWHWFYHRNSSYRSTSTDQRPVSRHE